MRNKRQKIHRQMILNRKTNKKLKQKKKKSKKRKRTRSRSKKNLVF